MRFLDKKSFLEAKNVFKKFRVDQNEFMGTLLIPRYCASNLTDADKLDRLKSSKYTDSHIQESFHRRDILLT